MKRIASARRSLSLTFTPFMLATTLFAATLVSCGSKDDGADPLADFAVEVYTPSEAAGFRILSREADSESGSTLIEVTDPWQGASGEVSRLLLLRGDDRIPQGYEGAVVRGDARRIVAMSSTYVAMLDELRASDRIVGVSGIDYIHSPYVRSHRDSIADVGNEADVDFERLVSLSPDLVLIYSISGPSAMEPKLRELGIPYIYLGDYVEQSPLGRAEWLVAVGEIVGRRLEAEKSFDNTLINYVTLRDKVAAQISSKPSVMINVPYRDTWYMPSADNYSVRLIDDAGGEYLFSDHHGSASTPIDLEQAYMLASKADCWLNPGQAASLADMSRDVPRFTDVPSFRSGNIYNNNARSTAFGGNDYYESGAIHPDIVLRDLVTILHPEIMADRTLYYYHRLR